MNITTCNINPYFDAEPTSYFLALKILAVFNIIITVVSLYTIALKSPSFMSKGFVRLILYHFTVGSLIVTSLSLFSTPVFYLPFIAFKFIGTYSSVGIPPLIQFTLSVILLLITGSTAIPLFYYRMDAILPTNHPLNSRFLRYTVYISVYVLLPILPAPILYIAATYEDQHELKQRLVQSFAIYYDDFMSEEILAAEIDGSNPIATCIVIAIILACISGTGIVSLSCYVILLLTSKTGKTGSTRYKAQQRHLFVALVIMVSVFCLVTVVIVPGIVVLLVINSYRTDIMDVLFFLGTTSISMGTLSYVLTYKPYRRFLFRRFFKTADASSSISTPSRLFVATKLAEKYNNP